mmetsp:Transcript_22869/g.3761  ORF Transcript_22869/g.3761 Transcript_22869/m.3761 type:complete len:118 (+) Transcript_22869:1454-1807(+)
MLVLLELQATNISETTSSTNIYIPLNNTGLDDFTIFINNAAGVTDPLRMSYALNTGSNYDYQDATGTTNNNLTSSASYISFPSNFDLSGKTGGSFAIFNHNGTSQIAMNLPKVESNK